MTSKWERAFQALMFTAGLVFVVWAVGTVGG